jgi:large subunit ribosomal protein L18
MAVNVRAKNARVKKTRSLIKKLEAVRLSFHKSNCHVYAQVTLVDGTVVASASTLSKEYKELGVKESKALAAVRVGKMVAEKTIAAGYLNVAFDRAGFKYHGCVKALADAAREAGLVF